jgi:hypothetical protein
MEILLQHIAFGRKLVNLEPLKSALVKESIPGAAYTDAKLKGIFIAISSSMPWDSDPIV